MNDKQLAIVDIVKNNSIEVLEGQSIIDTFGGLYKQVNNWLETSQGIEVTDVTQVEEMEKAREARLEGKRLRVEIENTRKDFKKGYLNKGRAVDMIAELVGKDIEVLENKLEDSEKFALRKAVAEKKAKEDATFAERTERIAPYVGVLTTIHDIKSMTDEAFDSFLSLTKGAFETKEKDMKEAQEELDRKEKAEAEENEHIRVENEKLKADKIETERLAKIEEIKRAEEKKIQDKLVEDALKAEREAREVIERELKVKEEAERKEKERIEAERIAKEEEIHKAQIAPDKEKIIVFADSIRAIQMPTGLSDKAQKLVLLIANQLLLISDELKKEVENL